MRKYFYIIIFLFACIANLNARSFSIVDLEIQNYPIIKAEFLALNDNEMPMNNLFQSDFSVFENGVEREVLSFNCGNQTSLESISAILSIDISESMDGERLDFAKSAAKAFVEHIDFLDNEVAVQSFNENNYLNQDFTNQDFKLYQAIDNLNSIGGTDFNATFLKPPAGIFTISQNAEYQPIAVILTDGFADGDEQKIFQGISSSNLKVYTVTLTTDTPPILEQAAELSGGKSFSNIDTEEKLIAVYKTILRLSQGIEPCTIEWNAEDCEIIREVDVNIDHLGLSETVYYKALQSRFYGFDFVSDNSVEFGIVPPNNPLKKIRIKAVNEDIVINDIISDNTMFSVTGYQKGEVVPKDNIKELNIIFSPINTDYQTAEITIDSDICFGNVFYASGGDRYNIGDKKLEIIRPNGGEKYFSGSDTLINWSGLVPSDKIVIQYSSNNGNNWNTINDSANNLKYKWENLPSFESDLYKIKAIQYSDQLDESAINIINGFGSSIKGMQWDTSGKYIYVYDNSGDICSIETDDNNRKTLLFEDLSELNSIHFHEESNLIAYSDNTKFIKVYNLNSGKLIGEFEAPEEKISKVLFSPKGDLLAGSSQTGKLYIWRISDTKLIHDIAADPLNINDFEWNSDGSHIITGGKTGSLKLWNSHDKRLLLELIQVGKEIKDISWSSNDLNIAVLKDEGLIEIWAELSDLNFFKADFYNAENPDIKQIKYSPDINYLAEIGSDSILYIRKTSDLDKVFLEYDIIKSNLEYIDWKNDSKVISVGSSDRSIHNIPIDALPLQNVKLQEDISDDNFSIIHPEIFLDIIQVGEVKSNTRKDTLLREFIVNQYDIPMYIDSIYFSNNSDQIFEIISQNKNVIEPNEKLELAIRFTPQDIKVYESFINISFYNKIVKTSVFGIGIEPDILLKTNVIDFGKVNINDSTENFYSVIENISDETITIDSVKLSGPDFKQFNFTVKEPFEIEPEQNVDLKLLFAPTETGRTSGSISFYFDSPFSPVIADLFGEGTAPEPEYESQITKNVVCVEERLINIPIKNNGTGDLIINKIEIQNQNDFELKNDLQEVNKIEPDEEFILEVYLIKNESKSYSTNINIMTNETHSGLTDLDMSLEIKKDSISYELNENFIEFIDIEKNREYSYSIDIMNTSTIPIEINIELDNEIFEVENIDPKIIDINETGKIVFKFKGTNIDGIYNSNVSIDAGCGLEDKIDLYAYLGVNLSELSILELPQFETLNCVNDKDTSKFSIKNTGKSPLLIKDHYFENNSENAFRLLTSIENAVLMPENEINIEIEYSAKNEINEAKLIINSNATNLFEGIAEFTLSAYKNSTIYSLSEENIVLNDVLNKFIDSTEIEILNEGDIVQNFDINTVGDKFYTDVNSLEIQPNSSNSFVLYFAGGEADNEYPGKLEISNQCGEIQEVDLLANVRGYAQVGFRLNDIQAKSGDTVQIVLSIYSPENIDLPVVKRYSTTICFDHSLLYPINGQFTSYIEGENRCVEIESIDFDGDMELLAIDLLVTNGDTTLSELEIRNSIALDTNGITIEENDGYFTLLKDNSVPLIDDSGIIQLFTNRPNPAIDNTLIEFNAIEEGLHKLLIIDIYGRKLETVFDKVILPGNYNTVFNTTDYSQGVYIYRLITPTQNFEKKMLIIK